MRHLMLLIAATLVVGCGASQDAKKGPDYCKIATKELQKRLGPEFDKVVTGRRLPPKGCALVYLQVQEEFAGEVVGESSNGFTDQRLAVLLPDNRGKPTLELIGGSEPAPGPVMLQLSSKELLNGGNAELIVQETGSPDYKGVRLFTYADHVSSLKEIFAANLKVKTPEGLDIAARWALGEYKGAKAIILDGAGSKKIFTWNRAAGRYTYNEVATNAMKPKPAAAPTPTATPDPLATPGGDDAPKAAKMTMPEKTKKGVVDKAKLAAEAAKKKAADAAAKEKADAAKKAKKKANDKADKLDLGELNL